MTCEKTAITLDIEVADIATVILSYDQIQIFRSTSGEGGPFIEVTDDSTRVDLEEGITEYQFVDSNGEKEYWYQYRYLNSDTEAVSALSSPVQGEQDPALDVVSVTDLKTNYLFGVDLTDDTGKPYPSTLFEHYIKASVDWLETYLDIQIKKTQIDEETHDFYAEDFREYMWFEVDHFPFYDIQEIKMVLPGSGTIQVFDKSWIYPERAAGQIQLLPGNGSAGSLLLGATGAYMPLFYGNNRFLPHVFQVTYSAGFAKPPPGSPVRRHPYYDKVPAKVAEVVAKIASLGPFNIAGDLLGGAGIASQSLGIDGLSMSFNTTSSATNAGYGSRILAYQKQLKEELPLLRARFKGLKLRVV